MQCHGTGTCFEEVRPGADERFSTGGTTRMRGAWGVMCICIRQAEKKGVQSVHEATGKVCLIQMQAGREGVGV